MMRVVDSWRARERGAIHWAGVVPSGGARLSVVRDACEAATGLGRARAGRPGPCARNSRLQCITAVHTNIQFHIGFFR